MTEDWSAWGSGDMVCQPGLDVDDPGVPVPDVLRRVAVAFRWVAIDWPGGDRYVEARLKESVKWYSGELLDLEYQLRGRTVLVTVADDPRVVQLQFLIVRAANILELHYDPPAALAEGRVLANKLAALLGYEFHPAEELDDDEDADDPAD